MADDSYIKAPAERLDYTWDWGPWLADINDTIASAAVAVPAGLTAVSAPVVADGLVTQRVEGGDLDGGYRMVCQITTVGGLVGQKSVDLTILER